MAEGAKALLPVEQSTVALFGRDVHAVRLEDGRIAAVFTDLCQALDLDRASQVRRVRADEVIREQLLFAQVSIDAGIQPTDVLTAWAIPTWLQGVQLSRLTPEKRPAILAFKREAADVLYRHFSQPHQQLALPASTSVVPSQAVTEPERPAQEADDLTWADYYEQMAAWRRWRADMERWRVEAGNRLQEHDRQLDELHSRVESVEEVARLVPELIERLGPATLTAEHQRTVQNMAKRLHELAGAAYPTIYVELGEHFHVAKYEQIPESRWAEVAEWFQRRIDAAARRRKS